MTNKDIAKEKRQDRAIKMLYERKFEFLARNKLKVMSDDGIDHEYGTEEMREEILDNGLLSPISVVGPYDDGTYYVVDGARRVNSLDFIANHKIPCYIVGGKNITHKEAAVLALCANKVKRNNDVALKVKYSQLIYGEYVNGAIDRRSVAHALSQAIGVSPRQARRYVNIVENGSESVQNALANGEITVNDADTIVSNHSSVREQDKWLGVLKDAEWGEKALTQEKAKGAIPEKAVKAGKLAEVMGNDAAEAVSRASEEAINSLIDQNIRKIDELLLYDREQICGSSKIEELMDAAIRLCEKIA